MISIQKLLFLDFSAFHTNPVLQEVNLVFGHSFELRDAFPMVPAAVRTLLDPVTANVKVINVLRSKGSAIAVLLGTFQNLLVVLSVLFLCHDLIDFELLVA